MTAWGDGWVLMTYLQWRSLDGLAHPSKNSCEIQRNNRGGDGRGGGVDLRQLRLCIRMAGSVWSEHPPQPSTAITTTPKRERERGSVIGSLQPQTRLVPEYQMWQRTRKVSCLCFVKCAMTKCWGAPPPDHDPFPSPHHTPNHTHTHTHTHTLTAHTCR